MKTEAKWKAIAMALIGVVAWAGEADARNAVGYIKRSVPAGFSMMSLPFELIGGGARTLDHIFGDGFADESEIIFFTQAGGFVTYTFFYGVGWLDSAALPAGNVPLPRGVGFWVNNKAGSAVDIVLRGQVPTQDKAVALATGFQLVSYGFPVPTFAPQPGAALTPIDGDVLIGFGATGFSTVTFFDGAGWLDALAQPVNLVLEPGVSYWYQRAGVATTWNQFKPVNLLN